MNHRKSPLGKTGLLVNPVGFGGIPIQRLSPEESDAVVGKALEAGINFFDTSRIYTDSEEKLGRVFPRFPRDHFYIASKTFSRTAQQALDDLETGLRLMKTDYIDLYQLHNISSEDDLNKVLAPGGVLEILSGAQKQGKIRFIGITGHKPPLLLKALHAFPFATVQVPFNYIEQICLEELIPYARANGVGVIAMKPLAGGALKNISANFRFILLNGADVIIPGMDSALQVQENLAAIQELTPPTPEELEGLEQEKNTLGETFCRRCEYCMPCPQGLPISFLHVLRGYYYRYRLEKWTVERIQALPKSYRDCNQCRACVQKCPYELDSPGIFSETWERIAREQGLNPLNPTN